MSYIFTRRIEKLVDKLKNTTVSTASSGWAKVRCLVCNRYVAFLLAALIYSLLIESQGGIRGGLRFASQYLEIPILLYLYWYLNAIMRPGRWTALLAAIPILLAYIGQDIFYLLLGKVFRVAELAEVGELMRVMSRKYQIMAVGAGALSLLACLRCLDKRRIPFAILGIVPIAVVLAWVGFWPQQFAQTFQRASKELINWSDVRPVETNGRFSMLLYREAQRRISLDKTSSYHDRVNYDEEAHKQAVWLMEHGPKKNVHVIVMESLVDPSLFAKARFSTNPVHPKYRALIGNGGGFSVSPIFGGKTPQAEFEVLCGIPAFQELSGVEFNSFSGSAAHCLPDILSQAGYRTTASNAYEPSFFNAVNAYKGMGFSEEYFPIEFSPNSDTYLAAGDTTGEIYMFDSVLFSQNLNFIRDHLRQNPGRPLFNYLLTMYGHSPHVLNKKKRPQIIKLINGLNDRQLERVANQFFYRSEAIADYLEGLLAIDHDSLIIIVADHLPPLEGIKSYHKLGYLNNTQNSIYLNRLIVIENGLVTTLPTIHHYEIPQVIRNSLSAGSYCQENHCNFKEGSIPTDNKKLLHEKYLRLMAHAIE